MHDVRSNHKAPGDSLFADAVPEVAPTDALDGEQAQALLRRLLGWLQDERDLQAQNRLDMAIDADMYDGMQWTPEDMAEVQGRGQLPLVFNEIAPMVDWMIGTERRSRVDARVLPRTEEDVAMADVKTKVMKYMSDVNRAVFVRSAAFAEAVKSGLSWIDDGVRDDPSKEKVYKTHESWRNVLHDSRAVRSMDLAGCRYLFRWRDIDLDVAQAMFPGRARLLQEAARDFSADPGEDGDVDGWGGPLAAYAAGRRGSGAMFAGVGHAPQGRRVVRIYECQYRQPQRSRMVQDGPFKGVFDSELDPIVQAALARDASLGIVEKVAMRMQIALFVPGGMLAMGPAPWRHNDFSLTPVWCYRRSRDGMPYGVIRRVRDLQLDLNKRASKANFLINTNQIIAEEGATDDWDTLRDEASRPDGVIIKKRGTELVLRRDAEQVAGQVQMMQYNAQAIQKTGGVADENLGRQTNAVSGEAIKARQLQGSVVTTEPFDNLRLAIQLSGSKELSLIEQFMSEEKVIRLVGEKSRLDWVKVNQVEVGPDGSVRVLDDITASLADFVVSEQDYAGTMRQVMFDSINALAQRVPPEVGLRLMTMAFEYSDLPNKDEIAGAFRRITGEPDPDKEPTPEELQAQQQQAQEQQQALQMQREDARLALQERQAKVREINARAAQLEAQVQAAGAGVDAQLAGQAQRQAMQAQAQASDEIEALSQKLAQAQGEMLRLRIKAESDLERARIDADTRVKVAQINAGADAKLGNIIKRLDAVSAKVQRAQSTGTKRQEDFANDDASSNGSGDA
ncbi:hypothetical protein CLI92_09125 [Vandammella animalimorsus]|uniref:Portal protein n=1 Tax=Vandammella animalimorsus TaxID=2029117 RepID=A0A2A2T4R7_9BURK|nr:hypothetical protein [Vandammella animalimorsus]PAX16483.1 hypothetical protein CLI92_09125 [Vandammella animalimorsus]PAX18898.1 hypothetical protein CLI93_11205 [Vandammella animalimorsus]